MVAEELQRLGIQLFSTIMLPELITNASSIEQSLISNTTALYESIIVVAVWIVSSEIIKDGIRTKIMSAQKRLPFFGRE